MEKYTRLDRVLVHKGVIIDFYADKIKVPNGNIVTWDFIGHRGAAAVIPVDEDGKILMVRQYRNAIDRCSLEIPAGGLEAGEDTRICAARELEEETGYRSEHIEHLIDMYTTVAFSNEKIGIYYALDLIPSEQKLDEDEFIRVERYTIEELTQMIFEGKIQDGKTVSAILAYKEKFGL